MPTEDSQGDEADGAAAESKQEAVNALRGKRVVICEDEGVALMQFRRALTQADLVVVGVAHDGQEAVTMVLRERPDIVLMDINMPILNGLEAARQILTQTRTCIVLLSAYAPADDQETMEQLAACAYITKPVLTEALVAQLAEAYARHCREPLPGSPSPEQ